MGRWNGKGGGEGRIGGREVEGDGKEEREGDGEEGRGGGRERERGEERRDREGGERGREREERYRRQVRGGCFKLTSKWMFQKVYQMKLLDP